MHWTLEIPLQVPAGQSGVGIRSVNKAGGGAISDSFFFAHSVQAVFARGIAASGHFICVGEGARGREGIRNGE